MPEQTTFGREISAYTSLMLALGGGVKVGPLSTARTNV